MSCFHRCSISSIDRVEDLVQEIFRYHLLKVLITHQFAENIFIALHAIDGQAFEGFLKDQIEQEEIDRAVKEGYAANYDFIKESSKEWDFSTEDGT